MFAGWRGEMVEGTIAEHCDAVAVLHAGDVRAVCGTSVVSTQSRHPGRNFDHAGQRRRGSRVTDAVVTVSVRSIVYVCTSRVKHCMKHFTFTINYN